MDLNREKKITRVTCHPFSSHDESHDESHAFSSHDESHAFSSHDESHAFSSHDESHAFSSHDEPGIYLGTIFYGTLLEDSSNHFIIEDIFQYSGISLKGLLFRDKLAVLKHFFSSHPSTFNQIGFSLPVLWNHTGAMDTIPNEWSDRIGYTVHHVQYRALSHIAPFINVFVQKPVMPSGFSNVVHRTSEQIIFRSTLRPDYRKPQYRQSAVFLVKADIQADIYRLFAYGRNKTREYVDIAYISNYQASVFMNGIFRRIKENANLDFIEESDDEEEFEDVAEDRYVDLGKEVLMEFVFLPKFKKWLPVKIADKLAKVVHIGQL